MSRQQLASLSRKLNAYTRTLADRTPGALWAAGEVLLDQGQLNVPRDTEALARSGNVRFGRYGGFKTEVIVGYGSLALSPRGYYWSNKEGKYVYRNVQDYAVYVHENVNQPAGNAFYLRHAILQAEDRIALAAYYKFQI